MATAVQVESLWSGLTDNNGQPLAAGKVFTYAAGTTTPVSLFTAADKSTSATNPLILDAYGKAQVWADGRYKFVVKTSADVTLYTLDNLLYGFDDTTVLYGGTSTGSANAQVVSVPATVTSYANGQTISFVAGYTNTGATTLQFNSLSAVSLVKGATPSSLQAGDLIAGQLYTATYHGGAFRLTDYPTVADVQRSRFETATGVAGTNTITANLTPALTGYETGMVVQFVAANTNTGATTLNLNGLGAKAVQRQGVALSGGELVANQPAMLFYDGTNFQILSNNIGVGTATAPAIYPGNDVNTGFFFPAADQIGIATNGLERARFVDGSVQINPVTGNSKFRIRGDYNANSPFETCTSLAQNWDYKTNTADSTVNGTASIFIEGGASNYSAIKFLTNINNTAPTERMQIDGSGNVGIGVAPSSNLRVSIRGANATSSDWQILTSNSTPANCFGVRNDGAFFTGVAAVSPYNNTSGTGANVFIDAGGYLGRSTSSRRYKTNIVDYTNGLEAVAALRPVFYKGINDGNKQFAGLIAEEVHEAGLHEFVSYNADNEPDALHYGNMVALAFKAIQELNAKVEALESRVAELEA